MKSFWVCQSCGVTSPKWVGRCTSCGEWNTYVEELEAINKSNNDQATANRLLDKPLKLSEIETGRMHRFPTGNEELDRVLGGGLVPGSIVLLGESFSGPIAISIAAANPVRVLGVILCCTFVRNPRPKLRWLKSLAYLPTPRPPLPIANALLLGRFATPKLRALLRNALNKVQPAVLRARLREVVSVDVRAQAVKLVMPVLYLKALNDQLVPSSAAAEAQQLCRDMEVEVFDAPHCLLQVVPVEASDAVMHFIDRLVAT